LNRLNPLCWIFFWVDGSILGFFSINDSLDGISMGYLKIQNTNPSKNPCWQAEESSNPMLAWMLRHIYFDQFLRQNGKPKWQQDIPFLG